MQLMVSLSIQPKALSKVQQCFCTFTRSQDEQVTLVREGPVTYLQLKLDLFWARARGAKQFGVLLGSLFTNCPSGVDFYVPVNPWHYAIPVLRGISSSMHTEEDIQLILANKCPELSKLLVDIPLQQCPGIINRTFDGELTYQFKEDLYSQHCKEKVIAMASTTTLGTVARAVEFCAQIFDCITIQQLRQDLGIQEASKSITTTSTIKDNKKSVRSKGTKQQSKSTKGAPRAGPIDAFLRIVKK